MSLAQMRNLRFARRCKTSMPTRLAHQWEGFQSGLAQVLQIAVELAAKPTPG